MIAEVCGCATSESAGGASSKAAARSLRIALLVLLKERDAHGYELYRRMQAMNFVVPSATRLYRLLRTMEAEGLVRASWELSERGPARRTYALNARGDQYLREHVPSMLAERDALQDVLSLYRQLIKRQP